MNKTRNYMFSTLLAALCPLAGVFAQQPADTKADLAVKTMAATPENDPIDATKRRLPMNPRAAQKGLFNQRTPISLNTPAKAKAPRRADGSAITFCGNVLWSNEWMNLSSTDFPYGFYTFQVSNQPTYTMISNNDSYTTRANLNGGGVMSADGTKYYGVSYGNNSAEYYYFREYDVKNSWNPLLGYFEGQTVMTMVASDVTRDPVTMQVYGCFYNTDYDLELAVVNYAERKRTTIGTLSAQIIALAADANGVLYGIGADAVLYKINKTTAALERVGDLGISLSTDYWYSATFDYSTGKLYATLDRSGEYDIPGLYEINPATGQATELMIFTNGESINNLYIPTEQLQNVPQAVSNLTVTAVSGQNEATVSFKTPRRLVNTERIQGNVTYHVLANGTETVSGEAAANTEVSVNITLPTGYNTVTVYASNEAGDGVKTPSDLIWIGNDIPDAVENLALKRENGQLALSWDGPKGVNGGYVDAGNCSYEVVRYPDNVNIGTTSELSITDAPTPENYTVYYYTVTVKSGGESYGTSVSNFKAIGPAYEVPYVQTFETVNAFNEFDSYDLNGDGKTWKWSDSRFMAAITTYNNGQMNDLLTSPPVHLQSNRFYDLSLQYGGGSNNTTEYLTVMLGKYDADYNSFTVVEDLAITTSQLKDLNHRFKVDEEGSYVIGFLCKTTAGTFIVIDNLQILAGPQMSAPASITDLTVTPYPNGAQKATITMTAPDKTYEGEALTSLTKIELYRESTLIHTFENPAVGSQLTYEDLSPVNGENTYTVQAFNSDGESEKTSVIKWIGIDTPAEPGDVLLVDNGDGTTKLSWTQPGGAHGGYTGDVWYTVGSSTGKRWNEYESTSLIDNISLTGAQNYFYYALRAETEAGRGSQVYSNYVLSGAPYTLPFLETWGGGLTFDNAFWAVSTNLNAPDTDWGLSTWDNGTVYTKYGNRVDDIPSYLHSGKIDISNASEPVLVFNYVKQLGGTSVMHTKIVTAGNDTTTVHTVDYSTFTESGWETVTIPLTQFKSSPYIIIYFEAHIKDKAVFLDNVGVREAQDVSVGITRFMAPSSVVAGNDFQVTVGVTNLGVNKIENATLNLYLGDHLLGSQNISINPNMETLTVFNNKALAALKDTQTLKAELVYEGDTDTSDNVKTSELMVVVNDLPKVELVKADKADETHADVSWVAPDLTNYIPEVTEDVESYAMFTITDIGEWTAVDGDNAYSYGMNAPASWTTVGERQAVCVFAPYELFTNASNYVVSGKQCFAMFCAEPIYAQASNGFTNDYLISPELSGKAQTISFWTRSINSSDLEDFRVLYSTEGADTLSLLKNEPLLVVNNEGPTWTKHEVQLPEGAKYFAIHHYAYDKFALLIDDISYQGKVGGGLEITGFNVYRDQNLLTTAAPAQSTHQAALADGENRFFVSVLYNRGESDLTEATEGTLGIQMVEGAGEKGKTSVYDLQGRQVTNMSGNGVYIIKTGDQPAVKVRMK